MQADTNTPSVMSPNNTEFLFRLILSAIQSPNELALLKVLATQLADAGIKQLTLAYTNQKNIDAVTFQIVATVGSELDYSTAFYQVQDCPLLRHIFQGTEPLAIVHGEDQFKDDRFAIAAGLNTPDHVMIAAPLKNDAQWLGLLTFVWDKPQAPAHMRDLIGAITPPITAVVSSRQAYFAEEANRRRAETLAQINEDLSRATNENEILAAVAALLERYHVTFSALSYIHVDKDNAPEFTEVVALRTGNGQTLPPSSLPKTTFTTSETPTLPLTFAHPNEPIFIENVFTDPRYANNSITEVIRATGVTATLTLALKTGEQWQGVLTFTWRNEHIFSPEVREVFAIITPTLASVVASRRAYLLAEANRRRAEALVDTIAQLSLANDENEILGALATYIDKRGISAIRLNYVNVDGRNLPSLIELVASRRNGEPWLDHPDLNVLNPVANDAYSPLWAPTPRSLRMFSNVQTDLEIEASLKETAKQADIGAIAFLPLFSGGQWQGLIVLYWREPHTFTEEEQYIYRALMQTTASVVASRRLYLKTSESVARLRELDRLKNEFMSSMSHELRTPLNAIIGLSDILMAGLDGNLPPKAETDITTIFNAGQQLLNIVNDVLDIAKIEAGHMNLILNRINLASPIAEAVETASVMAASKGLILQNHIPSDLPRVMADEARIRQIALNLLSNAIKFTEQGTVEISAATADSAIVLCVRDEGIGIDPKHHGLVFEQFRQVEGALTRKKGGTGLGLPISKRLVEMHGGKMWVVSEVGAGAKFYFSIPISDTAN
jgi:signal transduction histidine kinase